MSIDLLFSNPIISFKIFNSENKSKSARSYLLGLLVYLYNKLY